MGGFYGKIGRVLTEGLESASTKVAGTKLGSFAPTLHSLSEQADHIHQMFPAETIFQQHPATQELWKDFNGPYQEIKNKLVSQKTRVAAAYPMLPAKTPGAIQNEASREAQEVVFGPNRSGIQAVLKHVEKTVGHNRAQVLADHLNIMFQEEAKFGPSSFDKDMRRTTTEGEGFYGEQSKYKAPDTGEKKVLGAKNAMMAYKAAIPHLASHLNIAINDGFQTYAKTLYSNFGPGRKGAQATILASDAISELHFNAYREKQLFDRGFIHEFAPGSVGEFIHRNMFIPGMQRVRYETLMMSAMASKIAAEDASKHLMKGNDKWAIPMLHELHLDPAKIKAQGGRLLPDDIDKAYFHGTDTRAFLEQKTSRSVLSQRSAMFRVMGTFHNYVTSQARFFRNVFKRQYQQGDFVGIARNISLLSVAFPVVGATIYESEKLITGQDWDDPIGHLGKRVEATPAGQIYDAVQGRKNANSAARIAINTIENLAHIGSWGVATGYVRGAARMNLAGQILGPIPNMAVQALQDAWKAGSPMTKTDPKHPYEKYKPIVRDVLEDVLPYGSGNMLTHEFIPTKKEQLAKHPKIKRIRLKKTQSSDIFNPY